VLVADGTISIGGDEQNRAANRYTGIQGAFAEADLLHEAAHLGIGGVPEGGNVSFLDGHVEWRKFDDMHVITYDSPSFWF